MTQFRGFRTLEEAKAFRRKDGGYLVWDERTPKRKQLTARGREYEMCVKLGGLDPKLYPYAVTWGS